MKKLTTIAACLLVLLPVRVPEWLDTATVASGAPLPLPVVHGVVDRNDTLGSLLARVVSPAAVNELVAAALPIHDLTRIAIGRPFAAAVTPEGVLHAFSYGIDELRTLRVERRDDRLIAGVVQREYETRAAVVSGTIRSSLFAAVGETGEGDQLALDLADVFQWDVDFNTEIQKGDSFRVLVEKLYLDGVWSRYGSILAADFVRGDRVLRAVRFEATAGAGYFTPEGRPLRKAFLRSPLRFTRISSRFSHSRLHPVLGIRRPHLGIDYAAPTGTPVHAAGDGVVITAGWLNGYGRTVRLRHPNGYQTLYGHLSRIDVRAGQRVAQGTRIGAVGATGIATGPHLDYRMSRDGAYIDPFRLAIPAAEPVAAAERAAFDAEALRLLARLEGASRSAAIAPPFHATVVR